MNRYLVMLTRRPNVDPAVVSQHVAYLDRLREIGQLELSGPFGDQSGGAYLLLAEDMAAATTIVHADPAHVSGGWDITVYEWHAR